MLAAASGPLAQTLMIPWWPSFPPPPPLGGASTALTYKSNDLQHTLQNILSASDAIVSKVQRTWLAPSSATLSTTIMLQS